ncbi:hypothetical protein, partial [Enterobacter hormaechei]|uniref:hypothetical protein n=1 Tax=Enterobacter hormaechei TaxID=158836 RepID=UPI0034D645CB
ALLLAACSAAAIAHPFDEQVRPWRGLSQDPPGPAPTPVSKDKLLAVPAGAEHFVVVSDSAKHGDVWIWNQADGSRAARYSQSLRGWITETDAVARFNSAGAPVALTVRGVSPDGDAAETLVTGTDGRARWQATADRG